MEKIEVPEDWGVLNHYSLKDFIRIFIFFLIFQYGKNIFLPLKSMKFKNVN
jgi:hypothetical protein